MKAPAKSALDAIEKKLVEQSKKLESFSHRELTELARQLRSRRERILRMLRGRKREARKQGELNPDTGAHDKKAELIAAIDRVHSALEARAQAHKGVMPASKPKTAAKPKVESAPKESAKKSADKEAGARPAKNSAATNAKKPVAKKSASK